MQTSRCRWADSSAPSDSSLRTWETTNASWDTHGLQLLSPALTGRKDRSTTNNSQWCYKQQELNVRSSYQGNSEYPDLSDETNTLLDKSSIKRRNQTKMKPIYRKSPKNTNNTGKCSANRNHRDYQSIQFGTMQLSSSREHQTLYLDDYSH
jgi:hypothetical protein